MHSIVVFSQGVSKGREQLPVNELGPEAELAAARQVAEKLRATFRQAGEALVIDGVDGVDLRTITLTCREHKLTWMENRSFRTDKQLY